MNNKRADRLTLCRKKITPQQVALLEQHLKTLLEQDMSFYIDDASVLPEELLVMNYATVITQITYPDTNQAVIHSFTTPVGRGDKLDEMLIKRYRQHLISTVYWMARGEMPLLPSLVDGLGAGLKEPRRVVVSFTPEQLVAECKAQLNWEKSLPSMSNTMMFDGILHMLEYSPILNPEIAQF